MSALSRFGPSVAKTLMYQQSRNMAAAATTTDPVQRLFVDKVREFKSTKKGLDEAGQKAMSEEIARLRRVYNIEDEKKIAHIDTTFAPEVDASVRDIEQAKPLRQAISTGEFQKQLEVQETKTSELAALVPEQHNDEFHLPITNKPRTAELPPVVGVAPTALTLGDSAPDFHFVGDKMTPERLEEEMRVSFGPDMPTIHDDKSPQRDTVNFPRIQQPLDTPPTRYHVIPESWFQFFYPKTGVTGPYAFAGAVTTFLLSKEWIVHEHNLGTAVSSTIILSTLVIKFGPKVSTYMRSSIKGALESWDGWQKTNIATLNEMIDHYKGELGKRDVIDEIYKIRRQDIENQIEGEYRSRLKKIYDTTKQRLNYLVAVADSQRQISHKNMVDWVISNAVASIGPKQESEVLDSCIHEIRKLASRNPSAI